MRKILVGLVALLGLSIANSAFAADLPVKARSAPAPISNWSGWYVGFEIGEKWTRSDLDNTCNQLASFAPFNCGGTANPLAVDGSSPHRFSNSSLRTGGYIGAQSQVANWVFGLEGDWAYSKHSTTIAGLVGCSTAKCNDPNLGGPVSFDLSGDRTSIESRWDASARARVGYVVMPSIMIYGTGGIAWQAITQTMTCAALTSPGCTLFNMTDSQKKTLSGYTVGGGIEWMWMPNVILRGEYRYSDFGTIRNGFFLGSGDIEVLTKTRVTSQIATFGIAYKFSSF